ncbi:SDR family oxidoreductase [Uliginosibacterium sediminicola]|uniref:SDR family oxidoreductase n=1 Tax=Uliginosibacterium sediminicola TaxID=2024550 RepID=A0ABU9YUS1_9RHOO
MRIFLTGASSGIGAALARYYAAQGAQLGLVARRAEQLDALIASLPGGHQSHLALPANVADSESIAAAAKAFIERFGLPDIVIANAGISVGTLTEEIRDYSPFEAVLRTNVLGVVATFQPFAGAMRARGHGTLVGISSVAGVRGLPGAGAYSASKAAVSRYLESLRVELRGSGVKVVDIRPGYIATPMTDINTYPMPFKLGSDEAARRFARAIAHGRSQATIPWQMAIVARVLDVLPNALYDRLFAKAQRKPRGLPL